MSPLGSEVCTPVLVLSQWELCPLGHLMDYFVVYHTEISHLYWCYAFLVYELLSYDIAEEVSIWIVALSDFCCPR